MRVEIASRDEAVVPLNPAIAPASIDGDTSGRPEAVRLAPGQSLVPEELLEPPSDTDRRHVMKDLAAFLLDRHLRRLGRMRNPLELRLGRLLARLQDRSGYLELGFASLSDYVIERLGISVRRAQVLVQSDRRLKTLPLTSEAFARGQVTSSQIRLLLRIATPETESAWLERALRLNVRLLELEVTAALSAPGPNGAPGAQSGNTSPAADHARDANALDDDEEPGRPVSFECPEVVRAQWEWAVEICRRASGSVEPLWRCAEYIAADFLAGVPDLSARLALAGDARPDDGHLGSGATSDLASSAACPEFTHATDDDRGTDLFEEILRGYEAEYGPQGWAPSADGIEAVLPDSVRENSDDGALEIDRKLRELVRIRQGLAWQQGRLLATFSSLQLHRALGFLSFGRYCRERAGLGIRRARQLIALDRRLIELPALARAYRQGELSWVKASAVARVADESSEHAWMRMARSVTFRRLREETAVVAARIEGDPPEDAWRHPSRQPGQFTQPGGIGASGDVQVDSPWRAGRTPWSGAGARVQMCADGTSAGEVQTCAPPHSRSRVRFWAPDDVATLWQHALNVCRLVEGRPLNDWECVSRMIASFLHTWDVSGDPKWRRDHRIFERDGWRCRVPGCSSRRSLQVHHVIYRSHGGGNEDDNLAVLCATHHLQGIHAGRLRCRGSCEGHLRWDFGGGRGAAPIMTTLEEVILGPAEDQENEDGEVVSASGADLSCAFGAA